MAKKSMINRDIKRSKMVLKYQEKRKELKRIIKNINSTDEQRFEAVIALQSLPRDSSPARMRSRCGLSGKPYGFYRKFGLAKFKLREKTMNGEVSGVLKSSW